MDTFPRHPVIPPQVRCRYVLGGPIIPNLSRWPWLSCSPCFLFRLEFPELKMPCQASHELRAPKWWGKVREMGPWLFQQNPGSWTFRFWPDPWKVVSIFNIFNLTYVNCETTWMELLWRCYNPEISGNCSRKTLSSELTFDVMSMSMERIKKTERILYRYSKVL